MTLVAAWVRNKGDLCELVVASDSRLGGGGQQWDCCPKVVSLPRSDAVLAFAGYTDLAYPMMLQTVRAIAANPAFVERRYDITDQATFVLDVLNQMLDIRIVDRAARDAMHLEKQATTLLLAGWSWRYGAFKAWRLHYVGGETAAYAKSSVLTSKPGDKKDAVVFMGDAGRDAKVRHKALRAEGKRTYLDMQPLEVLRDMCRSPEYSSVGGAPQVVKVYRHMNAQSFGVLWRQGEGQLDIPTYGGRPLLDYEKPYFKFIDIDDPTRHATFWVHPTADAEGEVAEEPPGRPG